MVNIKQVKKDEIEDFASEIEKIKKSSFEHGLGLAKNMPFESYLKKQDYILVAMETGKTVGYILGKKIDNTTGFITSIAIEEPYRGKGTGKLLLQSIHDVMRDNGIKEVELTVGTLWSAQFLYFRRGYKAITGNLLNEGIRRLHQIHKYFDLEKRRYDLDIFERKLLSHYQSGDDAYLMKKDLSESDREIEDYMKIAIRYFSKDFIVAVGINELIKLAKETTMPLKKFADMCWSLQVLGRREGMEAVKRYKEHIKKFFEKTFKKD